MKKKEGLTKLESYILLLNMVDRAHFKLGFSRKGMLKFFPHL